MIWYLDSAPTLLRLSSNSLACNPNQIVYAYSTISNTCNLESDSRFSFVLEHWCESGIEWQIVSSLDYGTVCRRGQLLRTYLCSHRAETRTPRGRCSCSRHTSWHSDQVQDRTDRYSLHYTRLHLVKGQHVRVISTQTHGAMRN
mgnify:CR=1 FL=1